MANQRHGKRRLVQRARNGNYFLRLDGNATVYNDHERDVVRDRSDKDWDIRPEDRDPGRRASVVESSLQPTTMGYQGALPGSAERTARCSHRFNLRRPAMS
jgi:hypothetical protein